MLTTTRYSKHDNNDESFHILDQSFAERFAES